MIHKKSRPRYAATMIIPVIEVPRRERTSAFHVNGEKFSTSSENDNATRKHWLPRSASAQGQAAESDSDYSLKIVSVFEDVPMSKLAASVVAQVTQFIGENAVRCRSWEARAMTNMGVVLEAARAAAVADILVVSARAAHELSFRINLWIEKWLPQRQRLPGALVALIGPSQTPASSSSNVRHYLRTVAQSAGLDFFTKENGLSPLADPPKTRSADQFPGKTGWNSNVPHISHWGINE